MKNEVMKSLTFGVEIEMTGLPRTKVAEVVAKHFNASYHYEGTCYDKRTIKDRRGRVWTVERDASIQPEDRHGNSADGRHKVEFVTPILYYEDIEELQQIIRDIRHAGAKVNRSCGIHIHVGAEKFTATTLRNLSNLFATHEDMLYRALEVDDAHRNMCYCQKTDQNYLDRLNKTKPATADAFNLCWYNTSHVYNHGHYDESRYHGLNLHAFFTKGTVEFRLFNSTLHAGKIKAYIQFCLALAQQALTQKRASTKKVTSDNEKYSFRCWMLRLGLIGDEFKTCRLHFLKHLSGNSAWRKGHDTAAAAA